MSFQTLQSLHSLKSFDFTAKMNHPNALPLKCLPNEIPVVVPEKIEKGMFREIFHQPFIRLVIQQKSSLPQSVPNIDGFDCPRLQLQEAEKHCLPACMPDFSRGGIDP